MSDDTAAPVAPAAPDSGAIPIWPLTPAGLDAWRRSQPAVVAAWVERAGFAAKAGHVLLVPGEGGVLAGVALGVADEIDPWAYAVLPGALPAAAYRIDAALEAGEATHAALGFALGGYRFARYKAGANENAETLLTPAAADADHVVRCVRAVFLVRDLINTPAADMGPAELAAAAADLAQAHGATCETIAGDALLARNLPAIHAVGRARTREPRLIDLAWGEASAPKVTLVGKGVCFDSGALDLKPARAMRLMKKDMGGAATVLGLAQMIMAARLPVRLRVLIPAVENSVAGNAIRPGDVLALAGEEAPDLVIDCATLTGAARSALGPDLPALFTPDDALAGALARHAEAEADPLWRLPLWAPYRDFLDSRVADLDNAGDSPFAGAITAALFLQRFVAGAASWAHLDLYAWSHKPRPGRPLGGEAQGLRALYALIAERYPG